MALAYVSTRGGVPPQDFQDVLFAGLAPDGGLFVPQSWPQLSEDGLHALRDASYAEVAQSVIYPFVADSLSLDRFAAMVDASYAAFAHPAVAPLKQLDDTGWLLELFHGPTLAFKDFALQLLGRLFEHFLAEAEQRITVIGATSGDTGSAAIAACAGKRNIKIIILHPHERTSLVQRRQMTTVAADNVHNLAVEGTFDDCQAMVKALFNEPETRARLGLAAINSINWARIMAQAAYYVYAATRLGGPDVAPHFVVPTGNFGNVYAGHVARSMGLPIAGLTVATNHNDILSRFINQGDYSVGRVQPSISPSMDIQVASNFERALFELFDTDGGQIAEHMHAFARHKALSIGGNRLARARAWFAADTVDEPSTLARIRQTHERTGETVCPHTAVGLEVAARVRAHGVRAPIVTLATAHPAKFPDAVEQAIGAKPALPPHINDLFARAERFDVVANDLDAVRAAITAFAEG